MMTVADMLMALGSDADMVAIFLLQRRFHGTRGVGEECPLANYLRANGVAEPAVDATAVTYSDGASLVVAELPAAVEDFVMLFDDGAYPELEFVTPEPAETY
jgi:hypothetical protein